jgi:TolB-like protein/class 3 adenylate cyclase
VPDEGRTQRRLAAIVAADVAGYSRLVGEDEEGTLTALRGHRAELIDPLLKEYGGRIANTAGDSLLLEFPSAVDAVRCAIAIQEGMAERNEGVDPDKQIQFRVGINVGDVVAEGDDLLGDGVNVAARLEGLSEPGGICVSRMVRDSVRDRMDIDLEDMDEVEVKNIARPVRVFRVLQEGKVGKASKPKVGAAPWLKYVAAGALIVVAFAGGGLWWWQPWIKQVPPARPDRMAFELPDKPSIAVLPFDYLGANKQENEYLADGMSENIISALAQIPELFVIARNSTFTLKGKAVDVRTVSEQFGVRYVLEGSVQKTGDRIRVTAQLLDGVDGKHLWAETFDRKLDDIFKTQDDITKEIAIAMRVNVADVPGAPWRARGVTNLKAWALVMQASSEQKKFTTEGNKKAQAFLEKAVEIEETYAQAWALWAWVRFTESRYTRDESTRQRLAMEGIGFADKALELDRNNSDAYLAKAALSQMLRDYDAAVPLGEKALQLAPSVAESYATMSMIWRFVGEFDKAVDALSFARRLHPKHPSWYYLVQGHNLTFAGRFTEVIEFWSKHRSKITQRLSAPEINLTIAHSALGQIEKAKETAALLRKAWPSVSITGVGAMFPFKDQALLNDRLAWLGKAGIPEQPPGTKPEKPAIAVLPFANLSDDKEQEYFADGMTDDLITDLSKISGLIVIARNSVFTYKGKNVKVQEIAKDLNVSHVLEGSVRRDNNQVRINAQLIDATTGEHLWAETFDRAYDDIFSLQDEVTGKIIEALKISLEADERLRIERMPTANLEAYELYLKAREGYRTFLPERYAEALDLFRKAIDLDPDFAEAHAGLAQAAQVIWSDSWLFVMPARQALALAKQSATRALSLDPDNVLALSVFARVNRNQGKHGEAIRLARKAVKSEPNNPIGHYMLAHQLAVAGEPLAASSSLEEATRLEPRPSQYSIIGYGWTYIWLRRYGEAVELFEHYREEQPKHNVVWVSLALAVAQAHLGDKNKAALEVQRLLKAWPAFNYSFYRPFFGYLGRQEDLEHFIEGLRLAGAPQWAFGFRARGQDRLSGDEINTLIDGHRFKGRARVSGDFEVQYNKDGSWTWRTANLTFSGKGSIEGDLRCYSSAAFFSGRKFCYPIYRDPGANADLVNSYTYPTHADISEVTLIE